MSNEHRQAFLYNAINDVTNTIRFIDTKIGAAFVVMGIILSLLSVAKDSFIQIYKMCLANAFYLTLFKATIVFYIISTIIAVFYAFRTIRPRDNPLEHVNLDGVNPQRLWYLSNDKDNKISISLKDYFEKINNISEEAVLLCISFELMKLSYIRNKKMYNSDICIFYFMCSLISVFIIVLYFYFYYFICRYK